ncbi:MAG TPA: DUF1501 domain-containing protein, partial [Planctomycetaceae bacterium]|nr:DUF1501 domain-containing protein [Planctomycetaceae bacterium]
MNSLLNRRNFLTGTTAGLSSIALASLLHDQKLLAASSGPIRPAVDAAHPYAARPPHHEAAAKNVLVIFCSGACSQIDTFDYKP